MPAYLIANLTIHDPKTFADYGAQVAPMIVRHGGRYLVRGGAVTPAEGEAILNRVVVVEYPDMATARAVAPSRMPKPTPTGSCTWALMRGIMSFTAAMSKWPAPVTPLSDTW